MTAQIKQLRPSHTVVVVPDDHPLFGRTYQPVCVEVTRLPVSLTADKGCTESPCYTGPFVSSESRAREIGLEHTRKAAGTWRPAW